MAYNFTNLENLVPLFGAMPNAMGSPSPHPTNFINQLAAAITTAAVGAVSATPTSTSIISLANNTKRECTPEPPPAPKLSCLASPTIKPNQGTAPMDVENDSETESGVATTVSATPTAIAPKPLADKCAPLHMHDPNLFLNGLMSNTGLNSGYMFFPTAAAATATTSAASAGSMLMDSTALMAAAMQQMQQGYAGYALPPAAGAGVDSTSSQMTAAATEAYPGGTALSMKEVIKTKSCILFPPNPNAPPPTIRERPPGCRTVFVGGLPESISEEIIREIFESCGEITTLRMSKKNFCHLRYRHEVSIDRAIYLSGYRVRISNLTEPANFGRLHVDYAQARDDQYDYECKQRQLQREQRHRDRLSFDRLRSQSPPPIQHYTDHEASVVAENLRNNDTFVKAIQTITVWLERGDCIKRNANVFYSMIQSTHAHVRRLYTDKQQLEEDLRKARESYRKQMLTMSAQFTQIEKVFSAASHKKVWDHFTKAQRKNIDQWKKLATELRSVQIEDDEMEVSDDDREYHGSSFGSAKRARYDSENLKEENDSLRCQLEAIRNEMCLERTDIKYDSDFREKQIKVLQETIRNMQTQLLQTKMREQKDAKTIEQLEQKLKAAGVKQLLLKTKIKETSARLRDKDTCSSVHSETSEILIDEHDSEEVKQKTAIEMPTTRERDKQLQVDTQIIDIDMYKSDDDVRIIEEQSDLAKVSEAEVDDAKETKKVELAVENKQEGSTDKKEIEEKDKLILGMTLHGAGNYQEDHIEEKEQIIEPLKQTCLNDAQLNSLELFEAKVIALTSAFLVVQPFGVSTVTICRYLGALMTSYELSASALADVLQKYPNLFEAMQEDTPVGEKWKFCGFSEAPPKVQKENAVG